MIDILSDSVAPPIRCVAPGHGYDGRARFRSEGVKPSRIVAPGDVALPTIWTPTTVPADNNDDSDGRNRLDGTTLIGESVIPVIDMLPNQQSPMHWNKSIGYGIVLHGEIELELENGHKKTIHQGGIISQRDTSHLWRNTSDQVRRTPFILIEPPAYLHDGAPMDQVKPEQAH